MSNATGLLAYCRAGFEPELAAEFQARSAALGYAGYAKTQRDSGFVEFICDDALALNRELNASTLIFARQCIVQFASLDLISRNDRATPIVNAVREWLSSNGLKPFGSVVVEHSDADEGRQLAGLARSFGNALRGILRKEGLIAAKDNRHEVQLHVFLKDETSCALGFSDTRTSSPFEMGIPRLRMHADAPSRSALKLEEAFLVLLDANERTKLFRDGMTACDLGAAPGGWTWVLVRNGLQVTSIDNGPLRESLMESPRVTHLRADGFKWSPSRTLDWMVCDMVEQPRRVAERMGEWFANDWCRNSVFNLKLPMKKRWQEVELCLERFEAVCGKPMTIRAKQLYHDREEITVFAHARKT